MFTSGRVRHPARWACAATSPNPEMAPLNGIAEGARSRDPVTGEIVAHFPLVCIAQGRAPSRKSQIKRSEAFEARLIVRRGDIAGHDHEAAHARVGKFLQPFLHLRAFAFDGASASDVEFREVASDSAAFLLELTHTLLHVGGVNAIRTP